MLLLALRHTWPTHPLISFYSIDKSLIIFHLCFVFFCLHNRRHLLHYTRCSPLFFSNCLCLCLFLYCLLCPSCQTTQSSPFPTKLSAPCIKLAATAISIPIPRPKSGDWRPKTTSNVANDQLETQWKCGPTQCG